MNCLSIVVLFGLVAVSLCANGYDPSYQPQPMARPGRRPRPPKPSMTYNNPQEKLSKPFDADEVQRILGNAIPGKDYPIFSLDNLPQTSFKCNSPNIHYPGYYADVETGCQVFHFCPPKLENYEPTYQQPPSQGYRPPQEPEYRRKRATYSSGYGQQPATYYGQDEEQYSAPSQPSYEAKPQPSYPSKPQERPVPQRPRYENPMNYPSQSYEAEEKIDTFLCPNQTIFDQRTLVCDWFFNVICDHAVQNYDLANSRLYQENAPLLDEVPEVEHPNNLNLSPLAPQEMPQQQQKQYRPHKPMRPMPQQPSQPDSYEEQPY